MPAANIPSANYEYGMFDGKQILNLVIFFNLFYPTRYNARLQILLLSNPYIEHTN